MFKDISCRVVLQFNREVEVGHLVTDDLIKDGINFGIEGGNDAFFDAKRRCLCLAYLFVDSMES